MEYPYKAYSWTLLNENIAVKSMDKLSFLRHGTGIPVDVREFFKVTDSKKKVCPFQLIFKDISYDARIEFDHLDNPRNRLFWHSDLSKVIKERMPEWYT